MQITYLGQCGVRLEGTRRILIDPYLSYSVDKHAKGRAGLWERAYPPPVRPESLHGIDYILLTHDHTDHTDPETVPALAKANPSAIFVGPKPVKEKLLVLGIPDERIFCPTADTEFDGITPIPAAHEELHPLSDGFYAEYGYIVSLDGQHIYHSGDCCPYPGLAERICGVNAALLPVNGRDAFRLRDNCIGNFHPEEAVRLCAECNIPALMPLHHDLYPGNGMSVERVVTVRDIFAPSLILLTPRPGESVQI